MAMFASLFRGRHCLVLATPHHRKSCPSLGRTIRFASTSHVGVLAGSVEAQRSLASDQQRPPRDRGREAEGLLVFSVMR